MPSVNSLRTRRPMALRGLCRSSFAVGGSVRVGYACSSRQFTPPTSTRALDGVEENRRQRPGHIMDPARRANSLYSQLSAVPLRFIADKPYSGSTAMVGRGATTASDSRRPGARHLTHASSLAGSSLHFDQPPPPTPPSFHSFYWQTLAIGGIMDISE